MPTDPDNLDLPPKLQRELERYAAPPIEVPHALDEGVMDAAHQHFLKSHRRGLWLTWLMPMARAACAAIIISLLVIVIPPKPLSAPGKFALGSPDNVVAAFTLARKLESNEEVDSHWDINGDGHLDHHDVDELMNRATRLVAQVPIEPAGANGEVEPRHTNPSIITSSDVPPTLDLKGNPLPGAPRFVSVPIYLDPKGKPLAAYQIRFSASNPAIKIVGVESGDSVFAAEPPCYDRDALEKADVDHITLASFSTLPKEKLPTQRVRVATLHLMIQGDQIPRYTLNLDTAFSSDAKPVDAEISIK